MAVESTKYCTITVAFPNLEIANLVTTMLLDENLVAVGQSFEISSSFEWDNERVIIPETMVHYKTRTAIMDEVIERVKIIHPYHVAEICAVPIIAGTKEYFQWIDEMTNA